jgi:Rad3-related DNA helicase
MSDEDYDDITHLKTGRDITVEFVSPQEAKNTFGQISVRVKPKQTPVSDKKEIIELIINNQPDIFEIFKKPSKEELQIALDSWLNPTEDDSTDNNLTDEKKSSSANKSTPNPTKNRDIDAALSELLGDD